MANPSEFHRSSKRLDLLVRGINERGLYLKEWIIGDRFLAAVGRVPIGPSPDEIDISSIVDNSFPGTGETRIEAVHEALTGFLDLANDGDPQSTHHKELPPISEFFTQFANEVAINGLKRAILRL